MKIAIVGATGMVGTVVLDVLRERKIPYNELFLVASKNSVGKIISFCEKDYYVIGLDEALRKKPDIAIFSAGGETSLIWAPKFAEVGTVVIDNSSAWRMDPLKKLIIPEINGSEIDKTDKIIANPNCSTIQMLMVLAPIHKKYGIKRVVVSTYQSITGTGVKAMKQLENEYNNIEGEMAYNYKIHQNAIPHCDDFLENGYTKDFYTKEIKKLYAAVGWDEETQSYTGDTEPVKWVRIHNLPDFVYFNHAQHVSVAGIDCQKCHGPVEEMEILYQYSPLTMGWCINCHRDSNIKVKDNEYYTKIHEELSKKYGVEELSIAQMGGLECGKCHY